MKETVVEFAPSESGSLVGVLTRAVGESARRPAVVLLNAGVVPHIGPHRRTVTLARRIARAGFHVLRFDLAGLGESDSRASGDTDNPSVRDCRAAMDFLEDAVGAECFVFSGLCSGAVNSLSIAVADSRVSGIALLDTYGYRTFGFYWRRLAKRGLDPLVWKRLVVRKAASLFAAVRSRSQAVFDADVATRLSAEQLYADRAPPKQKFAADLNAVVERGGKVFLLYTGGAAERYSYQEQFNDAFGSYGLMDRVRCEFWSDSNHTFTDLALQERLCDTMVSWVKEHWG